MRLTVVSPFIDCRHGTERVMAELLTRLAEKYHCEIHLYSQRAEGLTLTNVREQINEDTGGIYWYRVPSFAGPHIFQFLAWLVANTWLRWWDCYVHGKRCDAVLSPGINAFDADIVVVHALFHRLWELSQEITKNTTTRYTLRGLHRRAYYRLLVWLEDLIYRNRNVALAAVSQRTANLLEQTFDRQGVPVLANAVDLAIFSPEARLARRDSARQEWNCKEDETVLLLIGNDWAVKGLPTLLDAMAICKNPAMKLLVAGADDQTFFRESARRLGISAQIVWLAPRADVISLYAAADVYVSPTREDAFALPPLEAMACGLPVITSTHNGGSEIMQNGLDGFVLSSPTDPGTLAEILTILHGDKDLCRHIGTMAARTAQAYTWDRNAAETWEFLNAVAARRGNTKQPG